MDDSTAVWLEGVNGEHFDLTHGDRYWLATDVKGLYDPPVKAVYEEPGNYPGARFLSARILRRDITFAVYFLHDLAALSGVNTWLSLESAWRKAWAFDRDCKLYINTTESGTRYLKLRLLESPEIDLTTDPKLGRLNQAIMTCVAGDPFWYQDDVVYSATTTTDTTFDPNPLPWPWPHADLPTETLTITVEPSVDNPGGLNPTDQPVWLKWAVPGSTLAPSQPYIPLIPWLGAPNSHATIWTIPDYSFEDEEQANRRLRLPGLIGGLRTEEVQKVYIDGRPTGGSFKLGFGEEITGNIAYNASTSAVSSALVALAGITNGDVSVTRESATNEVQLVRLTGGATGGTFTLSLDGQTTIGIPFNASDADVQTALVGLSNLGASDVTVKSTIVNEVQRVELFGEPTGGTFTLSLDGQTTAPIAYNATATQVASKLNALTNIDGNYLSVKSDDKWQHSPYHVTFGEVSSGLLGGLFDGLFGFIGGLFGGTPGGKGVGGINVDQLTGDASGLTGGAGLEVRVTTETQGDRLYAVTFQGADQGINLPQMTGSAAGLTGGTTPGVEIATSVDGSRPYVVTFTGLLSGVDVPQMTIDTANLTGGLITGHVTTLREGFTAPAENAMVDSDPRVEQMTSESGSALWARMNGVRFRNPVPPWTESKTFEVTVSGAEIGQMVTLRIPRAWTRPWGLE